MIPLFGRDNPFFPSDPTKQQTPTTNRVENLKPFTTQTLSLPNSARAVKKISITYLNLDGSISSEELELNNAIDWHEPFVVSQKGTKQDGLKKKQAKAKTIDAKFIQFEPLDRSIKIETKDKILRNFMLTSPHRIVLDFSRDTSFKPKYFKVTEIPFKQIRMGNHDKYYRVVIELDGAYNYKLQTSKDSYTIVCF
jgi:AMIN domain-containing protein